MPFTELVIPQLIQSSEARDAFKNIILPELTSILTPTPGFILKVSGLTLAKNNEAVPELNFHPVLGIEWKDPKYFYELVQSKGFQDFGLITKPYIAALPSPEVYETDTSPRDIFASTITDILRINISDDFTKEAAAKSSWHGLVEVLGDVKVLSGISINLPERLFLGMIGWSGLEQREKALEKAASLKENLEKLGDVQSTVVQFGTSL
ncbi:hypothetical protein DID88_005370 [Monilinia fructigena]|uniref:Uncharacterized protein n=1 Tax=Monilinia fructigena TaxID=38457 RepID=A0A395IZN1_9HELO|nr:hypothetical protein DID88_005370 [Monilinia fructigena]